MRLNKVPHASLRAKRAYLGLSGLRLFPCVNSKRAGYRTLTCLYETAEPSASRHHLSGPYKVKYTEHGKAVLSPCATHGSQTVRHGVGETELRIWKKQTPSGNMADRACNMAHPEIEWKQHSRTGSPRPSGVSLRENMENLRV